MKAPEWSRRSAKVSRTLRPATGSRSASFPACRACRYCVSGKPTLCEVVAEHGARGMLMDGTSRLRLPDGTTLQHGLRTACFAELTVVAAEEP